MKSNRDIEQFLITGRLHIEQEFGLAMLGRYLEELALLEAGVPYSELGIGARRAAQMPGVIRLESGKPVVIQEPKLLHDVSSTPHNSFAHLRLEGVMRSQDGASSHGINTLLNHLNAANQNDRIEGILLEVNSGGGEATAGNMLMSALESNPKPVVVYAHLLASAALHGTLPADEIIASSPGVQIGSIGTMVSVPNWMLNYYKHGVTEIYASKSSNKNLAFRELVKGNKSPLQLELDEHNESFLADVSRFRDLKGDVEHTLSGALLMAPQAKRRGLVDGIGGYDYALKRLTAAVRRKQQQR